LLLLADIPSAVEAVWQQQQQKVLVTTKAAQQAWHTKKPQRKHTMQQLYVSCKPNPASISGVSLQLTALYGHAAVMAHLLSAAAHYGPPGSVPASLCYLHASQCHVVLIYHAAPHAWAAGAVADSLAAGAPCAEESAAFHMQSLP
jgi:hypothetical protein